MKFTALYRLSIYVAIVVALGIAITLSLLAGCTPNRVEPEPVPCIEPERIRPKLCVTVKEMLTKSSCLCCSPDPGCGESCGGKR